MNILAYFRERYKAMMTGFLVGLLAGYGRVHYFEPDLDDTGRWILVVQIAIAFSVLALFITNYLELRARVIAKVQILQQKEALSEHQP